MCERPGLVGRRGGRAIVGGVAPLPQLLPVESAAAGAAPGKAGPVWSGGANAMSRWGGSRHSLSCTAGKTEA